MSELGAKKLAEVEAFLTLAGDIINRSTSDFKNSATEVYALLETLTQQTTKAYVDAEMQNIYAEKTDKTVKKLTSMMELYIGDSWDNSTEVLEWSSFYSGAGAAHCAVAGSLALKDGKNEVSIELAKIQSDFSELLNQVILKLGK